jgi:NAD(P)H-hydrate epimerase
MSGRRLRSLDIAVIDLNSEYLGVSRRILMENAGAQVASAVAERVKDLGSKRVVVLAGSGNNGGDALVAARHLAAIAGDVHVVLISRTGEPRTEEARSAWEAVRRMAFSVRCHVVSGDEVPEEVRALIASADVIVDGIFGTGLRGPVGRPYSTVFSLVNSSKALVFAVDVPSGINPDTGDYTERVRADCTICLHAAKPFVDLVDAGVVSVRPIGAPPDAELVAGPGDAEAALASFKGDVRVLFYDDGSELASGAMSFLERLGVPLRRTEGEAFRVEAEGGVPFSTTSVGGVLLVRSEGGRELREELESAVNLSRSAGTPVWKLGRFDAFASPDLRKANWLEPEHMSGFTMGAMVALAAVLSASADLHYAVGASIYLSRRALKKTGSPPRDPERYVDALASEVKGQRAQGR